MSREHIEFIHKSKISWQPIAIEGFPNDLEEKLFSVDHQSRATTSLLKLLPESIGEGGAYLSDVEILILEGSFQIGNQLLEELDYIYLEKNTKLDKISSLSGCKLLLMTEGPLVSAHIDEKKKIMIKETNLMPWEETITDGFPIGAMRKSLYHDSTTGKSTWFLGVLPQFRDQRLEVHPVSEEAYQIYGTIKTNKGAFSEGSYFWRPPEIPHGDFDCQKGCLTLFRTDGQLETKYINREDLQN